MLTGHGDDIDSYDNITANFSSNTYGQFDHKNLFGFLYEKINDITSYPEPAARSLERRLASTLRLTPSEVCVTNGATEAIYLVAQAYRRHRSAVLVPTFSEYADACRLHEHKVRYLYDLDHIPHDTDIVWICDPNNPTGTVLGRERLMQILHSHEEILFVIDASYASFTLSHLLSPSDAVGCSNVIMIHSMTKRYSIPGLRLGYITANEHLMSDIRVQKMPWSVNKVAINAGHYLLAHEGDYILDLTSLFAERDRLVDRLSSLGFVDVWPSDTHILLCKLRIGNAESLKEYLANTHGVLIRYAGNFEGLDPSFFRISVQGKEENDKLVDALSLWIME